MLNGRNDYVSISVYFAFEANISITRLVDKTRVVASRKTLIPNNRKFLKVTQEIGVVFGGSSVKSEQRVFRSDTDYINFPG